MEDLLITLLIIAGLSYALYEYTPLHCITSPIQCATEGVGELFSGVSGFFSGLEGN